MDISHEQTEALEKIIDKTCLRDVLAALAIICFDKSEHIAVNWQDQSTAETWEKAGHSLNHASMSEHIRFI